MNLLLYANESEVRYIDYQPRFCIGLKAVDLPKLTFIRNRLLDYSGVILFGSCGLLKPFYDEYCYICDDPEDCDGCENKVRMDRFVVPEKWFNDREEYFKTDDILPLPRMGSGVTMPYSVRSKHLTEYVKEICPQCEVVDQESYIVGKFCQDNGVKFVSVRYVIDRCNRGVMLPAMNHFWRKHQHKRMQRKFNELIRTI